MLPKPFGRPVHHCKLQRFSRRKVPKQPAFRPTGALGDRGQCDSSQTDAAGLLHRRVDQGNSCFFTSLHDATLSDRSVAVKSDI